eukprot:4294437-Karenia_brevis.AAC.1
MHLNGLEIVFGGPRNCMRKEFKDDFDELEHAFRRPLKMYSDDLENVFGRISKMYSGDLLST